MRTSESIIVRTVLISDFLTIVFLLEAEKARLSMTSLYEGFTGVRIALLNPEILWQTIPLVACCGLSINRIIFSQQASLEDDGMKREIGRRARC